MGVFKLLLRNHAINSESCSLAIFYVYLVGNFYLYLVSLSFSYVHDKFHDEIKCFSSAGS
jgi:hypothetical protein